MNIKKVYLLFNPFAGSKNSHQILEDLTNLLNTNNITYTIIKNEKKGDLVNLARITANTIAEKNDEFMVVVGGDGTLSNVINGIKKSRFPETPVAFLATGTTNNFQNASDTPSTPEDLLKLLIENPKPTKIDLGHYYELHHHYENYFIDNVSIGFEALIREFTQNSFFTNIFKKLHLMKLMVIFNFFKALSAQQSFRTTVTDSYRHDSYSNTFMLISTNHEYFANEINFVPTISNTDQKIGLIVIERPPFFNLIKLIYKIYKDGTHINSPYFHIYKADKIRIETTSVQTGQLDGESLGNHTFDLEFSLDYFNLIK